jgi:hypothetical protein
MVLVLLVLLLLVLLAIVQQSLEQDLDYILYKQDLYVEKDAWIHN